MNSRLLISSSRIAPSPSFPDRKPHGKDRIIASVLSEDYCGSCRIKCCSSLRLNINVDDPHFDALVKSLKALKQSDNAPLGMGGYFQANSQDPDNPEGCPLFSSGKCSVYPERAESCRTYPLYGLIDPAETVVRVIASIDCPAVIALVSALRSEVIYVSELVELADGKLRPKVPLLGDSLIALLEAKTPFFQMLKFYGSEDGPYIRLTPYDLSTTRAIAGLR